ncbi:MAG: sulfatase [Planctomycetales bacterium]|nr:sulfatase [Planctomycetales bacterium]
MVERLQLCCACVAILFGLVCAGASLAKEQPFNVLIISTDEHHFGTLGCYGGTIVGTPNIDSIARRGALCTSFYATTPVCSPSRAALVSGRYPQKTPVVTNDVPMDDSIVTFAEVLRRRGYATGFAGKWHLDGPGKPQWAPERQFGFTDNRFMFNRGHWKKLIDTPAGPRVGAHDKKGHPNYDLNGADEKTFSTDWLCQKAIDFIHEHHAGPFCYMLSLPDPHGPNTVRAPYDTMYDDVEVPIPVSLKAGGNEVPQWGRPSGVSPAQLRRIMPQYFGMVKCIDDGVGRILAALGDRELLDRTIVVFTSDHGDLCGEHGRLNKGVPYEGSARIPFLIAAPGAIEPGTVIDEALACVDFLPTLMALLETPLSLPVDGRDASPLFKGEHPSWDDTAFLRSTPRQPWLCAVTQQYKLVFSAAGDPWFIDVQNDPAELTNLFHRPEHAERIRQLTTRLREYCQAHQDPHGRVPAIHQAMQAVLD